MQDRTGLFRFGPLGMFVVALLMGLVGLQSIPPLWWDEGWTLCVARTWVEMGHYGCLLAGKPAPPMLSGHFPVVSSIAASFSLFGIGIWQARLVGLLYTLLTLGLLYELTAALYDRETGVIALGILLFLPVMWEIHPVILGRQVLGEMPMLCFLLAGYASFLRVDRHRGWGALAIFSWAVALMTKSQTAPFWTLSLLCPAAVCAWRRDWRLVRWIVSLLFLSWLTFVLLDQMKDHLLGRHGTVSQYFSPKGLLEASAIVLVPATRWNVLVFGLHYCLPAMVGYGVALGVFGTQLAHQEPWTWRDVTRLMVWTLGVSWLGWFLLLSVGWERYVFPAVFLSAPFLAGLVRELSLGGPVMSRRELVYLSGPSALRYRLCGLILLMGMGVLALDALNDLRWSDRDTQVTAVAAFLNDATPAGAVVETFDSELFLLLQRPFHYPPAQVNVELIRRQWHGGHSSVAYDPLMADPDYIVVGRFGRWLGVYQSLVEAGQVRLVRHIGRYEVFERIR